MRLTLPALTLSALLAPAAAADPPAPWRSLPAALAEPVVIAVAADLLQPDYLVAAGPQRLHASSDGGRSWQMRFQAPGEGVITGLAVRRPLIFAATSRGLYGSPDEGASWTRLFRGRHDEESWCTSIACHPARPHTLALGTRRGAFISHDGGQQWTALAVPRAAREIVRIAWRAQADDQLLLLTSTTVFVGDLSGTWTPRFRLPSPEETESATDAAPEEPDETEDSEEAGARLSAIAGDPQDAAALVVAGTRGAYRSGDAGASWSLMPRDGLASIKLSDLAWSASPPALYAATRRGVARYDAASQRWHLITEGRATTRAHQLAAAPDGVWAATDQGLYRLQPGPLPDSPMPPAAPSAAEPTIAQVREAAIRYAEVHPDKIAGWRRQARYRAALPHLSISADTNLTDFRHWDSGANPDALLRGERDIDWSTTLTWELGDLVWSSDQTSIDVRSKLMVQLRNDIVDEVTRLYFERRRLRLQLAAHPVRAPEELAIQQLRLEELTALLDGLTGGWFSSHTHTTETQNSIETQQMIP